MERDASDALDLFFESYSVGAIKSYTDNWFKQTYGVTENFTVGSDIFGWTALATNWLKSTHYAVGTYGNDIISTVPAANGSYVNNATLELIGGSDVVNAGRGDDIIIGTSGIDIVDGAEGDDTLDFSSFTRSFNVSSDEAGYDGSRLIINFSLAIEHTDIQSRI